MKKTDVLIIGGGSAGLTAAFTAKGFNKDVLLIEKNKLGGECTWNGCIPSKALIKSSKIANKLNNASKYGINIQGKKNYNDVLKNLKNIQNDIYKHESPEALKQRDIEVIIGEAKFINKSVVEVNNQKIKAKKIILATGSEPRIPKIDGLEEINYLTNQNLFNLDKLPNSLGIVGAGPIGIEIAQSFNRLGVKVSLFIRHTKILKNEDPKLSNLLKEKLIDEGIKIYENFNIKKLSNENNKIFINNEISVDKIFFAIGRKVNYKKLNLDSANIKLNKKGIIKTNKHLKTTNKNVFCCGDIIGPFRLSHMAYEQAKIATMNALLPLSQKVNYENIIWTVFSDPELAHLGYLENYKDDYLTFEYEFKNLDRSLTDKNTLGLAKVITDKKYKILEANILGPNAGELIHHLQILKSQNIPLYKAESMIYAYPTYSEILRELGKKAKLHRINNNFFMKLYRRLRNE